MLPETLSQLALAGGLSLPALLAGLAAAQSSGPVACTWPTKGQALYRRLLGIRDQRPLGRVRCMAGTLLIASLFAAGALAAYAAQPGAPERLPREAIGVVGSGDQLALRLVQDSQERTLKPGDDYADGWKLDALTATSAILTKDGERREVGLNPTGALASKTPAGPPSRVILAGEDARLLAQAIGRGIWDGKTPRAGLTLEETQRWYVLNERFEENMGAWATVVRAQAAAAGLPRPPVVLLENDILGWLGPDYAPAFAELTNKETLARNQLRQATYDRYGPVTVHVPAGVSQNTVTSAYGEAAWGVPARQADGSYDLTLANPSSYPANLYSMEVAANPPEPARLIMVESTDANGKVTMTTAKPPP